MMIDKEELLELEREYGISFSQIMKYYTILKDIPCVANGSEENFRECLEIVIQDRVSNSFIVGQKEFKDDVMRVNKSLDYSISYALYYIYDEEAIPYLSEEFKNERDLNESQLKSGL
jgi:hypothetical protein